MTGSFLDLIVQGSKTVESRFHRQRRDPLFSVNDGDLIVFRQSGRPAAHAAWVREAHFIDLAKTCIDEVRSRWQRPIGAADDEFWAARRDARWVSLFEISPAWCLPEPVELRKRDRRAWVRYQTPATDRDAQLLGLESFA
jgi:hypothetical protein